MGPASEAWGLIDYRIIGAFEQKSSQGFSNYHPACLSLFYGFLG